LGSTNTNSPSIAADVGLRDAIATQEDIARIIQSIKIRDERIIQAEAELKKVTEDYRRLREELLPVFRMAKEMSQPLPQIGDSNAEQAHGYDQASVSSPAQQSGNGVSRKYSTKKLTTPGAQPKNSSPTHIPLSNQDSKLVDASNLDPSAAAVAASSHLTTFISGGGSQPSSTPHQPNMPSPTSPHTHSSQSTTLPPHSYLKNPSASSRTLSNADDSTLTASNYHPSSTNSTLVDRDRSNLTPTSSSRSRQDEPPGSAGSAPTVEIFKSFRVSMDDPCYKVLPAALKKYQINADWRQYALYIVYGDQERCLDLQERPLILFKQLDREGKKPMFMLRRHQDGHASSAGLSPGSAGLDAGQQANSAGGRGQPYQSGVDLPGGVL
jgi:protein STE50